MKKSNPIIRESSTEGISLKVHEDAKTLSRIGQKIISCLSLNEIISTVYEEVNNVMDATSMNLGIYNKKSKRLDFPGTMERGSQLDFHWADLNETHKLPVVCYNKELEILINDVQTEAKNYTGHDPVTLSDDGEIVEALIYLPLYSKESLLGVISVQSFEKNSYTDYHLDILKNIGNYVGIAIENAQLYEKMEEEIKERTREVVEQKNTIETTYNNFTTISEIGKNIISSLSVEEIIEKTYDNVNSLMDASSFAIGIYNQNLNILEFSGAIENSEKLPYSTDNMQSKSYAANCFLTSENVVIGSTSKDLKTGQKPIAGKAPKSLIYLPLISARGTIGVITVQSFTENAYSNFHLGILETLANYTAIALENAASFESIATLSEIGKEISSSLDLNFVLSYLYKKVNEIMDASIFLASSFSNETNIQTFEFCMEKGERILQGHTTTLKTERENLAAWVAFNKKEVIINDFLKEYKTYIDSSIVLEGERPNSLIYIPLIVERNVIGIISIQSLKKNAYSKQNVELLRSLASYVSGAFNNALAYKELESARQEMEKLSIVASETDNAVIIMDRKGYFEWVNKAYTKMSGFTLETLIKECGENLGTINNNITQRHFHKVINDKASVTYELNYKKRNGDQIWVQTNLSPVLDKNNEITKLIAIDSDITETKMGQIALTQSQQEYKALFEQIADSIFIFDLETLLFLDCNNAMLKTYGYTKTEILKMTPLDLHPTWEKDLIKKNIKSEKNRSKTNEYYHLTKKGKGMMVEIRSENIIYRGANATMSIIRDITERKEFEDKIIKQNIELEKLSIVASKTDNSVIICSAKGELIWANDGFKRTFGKDLEEFKKEKGNTLIETSNSSKIEEHVDNCIKTKRSIDFETFYLKKNGTKIWIQSNLTPVFNNDGSLKNLIIIDSDITERKVAELKVQEKNKDITDSINYASRIQRAMLPQNDFIIETLPNSFILYKPRDIVSGDFYWMTKAKDGSTIISVVDCTGHGVPGAFLTIVGNNILNQIVNFNNITDPAEILQKMNKEILNRFEGSSQGGMKDGMDMSICKINYKDKDIQVKFAGAFSSLYYINDSNISEIKGSRFPIGTPLKNNPIYTSHSLQLKKGDSIYLSSDGYQDQFGGPRNKKFKKNNFTNTLLDTSKLPINEQRNKLNDIIEEWMGNFPQIDDILIMGVTF